MESPTPVTTSTTSPTPVTTSTTSPTPMTTSTTSPTPVTTSTTSPTPVTTSTTNSNLVTTNSSAKLGSSDATTLTTTTTTTASNSNIGPQSTTTMQTSTSTVTFGSTSTMFTTTTLTTLAPSNQQYTSQSSTLTTIITTQLDDVGLPIENLLNIKYERTTTHNWYFLAATRLLNDSGSADNFLNYHLQSRWPTKLSSIFPDSASTRYFKAVGVTNSIPAALTFESGLFQKDTSSLRLDSKGKCLPLFNISSDHPYNKDCISEPEKCEYGFSAALWVKFQSDVLQNRDYLLTSGPDGLQGFKFYHRMGQLYIEIVGRNTVWKANMPIKKYVGSWSIVAFSWRRFNGQIRLLVGDQFVTFNGTQEMHNMNLKPSTMMYLGCMNDYSGYSDPLTAADISVAHIGFWLWPVREKALLAGAFVYQMVKETVPVTTEATTPAPAVIYDFSKDVNELIGVVSDPNPFYTVADEYISVANTPVTDSQVEISTKERGGFRLTGKSSKINVSKKKPFLSNCPRILSSCLSGLSLSMWLMIPNSTDSGDIFEIAKNLRISYSNQVLTVIVNNGTKAFAKSTAKIYPGIWQNLAIAITPANGRMMIFINGITDTTASNITVLDTALNQVDGDVSPGDFIIGSGASNTFVGVEINDVILWRKYLFSFEGHRFIGYTKSQLNQLQNNSNFWTTDKYIHDDSKYHINRKTSPPSQIKFSLSSVLKLKVAKFTMDSDPFSKSSGQCPTMLQQYTDYLFLARSKTFATYYSDSDINWTGECLSDPCQDKCRFSGISLSMWLKIKSVSLSKIQFYFNSGDMANYPGSVDGRGVSFFTDQQLFGVSLSTCTSDWNIIIDANRYKINEWMNIGILWREDVGLKLLIDGVDYGLINKIPDQIYKRQDIGMRAVLGRYDTDDQTLWRSMGYWEMSNFVFGEMGYFDRYLTADEYVSVIGMVNSIYYSSAVWIRQGNDLVNHPIGDLLQAKNRSQSYNYEGVVRWNTAMGAIRILSARIPVMIDSGTCPTVLNKCDNGFSIGGWFYITSNFTESLSDSYNLIIQGDVTASAFGVRIFKNGSLYGWVQSDTLYSAMAPRASFYASFNEWIFVGLIWRNAVGVTVIVNGRDFFSSSTDKASVPNSVDNRVFVGDVKVNVASSSNLLVYNTLFYNMALNLVQLPKLLGIQYNQALLLSKASFFWSVNGLYYSLIKSGIQMNGVTHIKNKYDTIDAAICTSGSDQSNIVVTPKGPHCLKNPDLCTSFILIMNINFSPLTSTDQTYGFILNVGNNKTGTRGLSIIQTASNTIEFYVRSSKQTCKSVMKEVVMSSWVQMKFIWNSMKNPIVKIDENTKVAAVDASCYHEDNADDSSSNIILGYSPLQSAMGAKLCVSELMLMHVLTQADPESESSGMFSGSCYENMDLLYPLKGTEDDQYQMPQGASKFSEANIAEVLPANCLTNPGLCRNGLSFSVWVKVDHIAATEAVLITVGGISRRGVTLTVLSSSNTSSFGIKISLHTGSILWTLQQDGALTQSKWTNVGVTWNILTGLSLFFNGILLKSVTVSTPGTAQDASLATKIDLGKSLTGSIDNLVVWFSVVASCQTPQASHKTLTGACKSDSTIPMQKKCSVMANCVRTLRSLCLDETQDNVIRMANSGMKISSPTDAGIILNIVYNVLQNNTPTLNVTMASVSLLLNVATNLIVSEPLTMDAATTLIRPFVNVNGEIMLDKYQNDWSVMVNQSLYNPLSVINAADDFYLRIAQQLSTTCVVLSTVLANLGVSLLKIDVRTSDCSKAILPNYADVAWTLNASSVFTVQDQIQIDPARIAENGPLISISSSIYNSRLVIPSLASDTVNPKSALTLNLNSKILTLSTAPPIPTTANRTLINVQLKLVDANTRPDKAQAWDIIDPSNPNLFFKWFAVFWNSSMPVGNSSFGTWDSSGCTATSWNTTNIAFSCDHMTSFTILMEPTTQTVNDYLMTVLSYVTMTGLAISLLSLLIFIITIAVSKTLSGTRYVIHLNMSCSLLLASLAFILVQPATQNQIFCQTVGVMMHLFFLGTFSWLLVEALYVFYAVTSGKIENRFKGYVTLAWGLPIIIVGIAAGLNIDAYGRNKFCWLSQSNYFLWTFLGPIMFFIFGTIVMSLIVACNITTPAIKGESLNEVKDNIKQTAYTIPLMLLGWIFGIIYVMTSNIPVAFLFVILCSLQGLWVLIFFGFMNQDFRLALCRRSKAVLPIESEEAILNGIETDSGSKTSLRAGKNPPGRTPPPKYSAPVYYSGNPKSKPPRHMDSVDFSRSTLNSERNLINRSYQDDDYNVERSTNVPHNNRSTPDDDYYHQEIDTRTLENNGVPIGYSRSIPGTPHYEE